MILVHRKLGFFKEKEVKQESSKRDVQVWIVEAIPLEWLPLTLGVGIDEHNKYNNSSS